MGECNVGWGQVGCEEARQGTKPTLVSICQSAPDNGPRQVTLTSIISGNIGMTDI